MKCQVLETPACKSCSGLCCGRIREDREDKKEPTFEKFVTNTIFQIVGCSLLQTCEIDLKVATNTKNWKRNFQGASYLLRVHSTWWHFPFRSTDTYVCPGCNGKNVFFFFYGGMRLTEQSLKATSQIRKVRQPPPHRRRPCDFAEKLT